MVVAAASSARADLPRFVPGEVLVHVRDEVQAGELEGLFQRFDVRAVKALGTTRSTYRFRLAPGAAVEEEAAELARDPRVAFAEPNYLYTFNTLSADPLVDGDADGVFDAGAWGQGYANLWGLEAAGWGEVRTMAGALWSGAPERTGGAGVVVAVIDSGLDVTHPDIAANVWRDPLGRPGRDFVDIDPQSLVSAGFTLDPTEDYTTQDDDPADRNGHGTHVTGIIAAVADNGQGIAGVAWKAKVMPLRAGFNAFAGERPVGILDAAAVAEALRYAADHGAHIVNMSFGGPPSQTIGDAITYAAVRNVALIASAGNGGQRGASYPASHAFVLAVGALEPSGRLAGYSNFGEEVALAAPGSDVLSLRAAGTQLTGTGAVVGERYIRASGTSMAAPHAAGAAALAKSLFPEESGRALTTRLAGASAPRASFFLAGPRRVLHSGGTLDLLASLTAPAGPHLALLGFDLDAAPTRDSNGDGVATPGETVQLALILRNVWQAASGGSVSLELVSGETAVEVAGGPIVLPGWPAFTTRRVTFPVKLWGGIPVEHLASLRLEVRGGGFAQGLPVALPVHESPVRSLVAAASLDFAEIQPDLASAATGSLAVAWVRRTFAGPSFNVLRFRLFAPDGRPLGADLELTSPPAEGAFRSPKVARLPSGSGAVAWTRSPTTIGGDHAIQFRLFDASGNLGTEIHGANPNPREIALDAQIALHDDGRIAVGWWAAPDGGPGKALVRFFDRQGQPLGEVIEVSAGEAGYHSNVRLHFAPDGALLVLWRQVLPGDSIRLQALARRVAANGSLGTVHEVLSQPSGSGLTPELAALPDDSYVAAWDDCHPFPPRGTGTCRVLARRLGAGGEPVAPEVELMADRGLAVFQLDTAAHESGAFAAAWTTCRASGIALTDCNPHLAVLAPAGAEPSQSLEIDRLEDAFEITLAATPEGFRVVWSGYSGDGDDLLLRSVPLRHGPSTCQPEAGARLCLDGGRFAVEALFRDARGRSGTASALPLTEDSGALWFFNPDNAELLVKALDGRPVTGFHWLFYGALSNVEYSLLVTDTETGAQKLYFNPHGTMASVGDTRAFAPRREEASTAAGGPVRGAGGETLELRDGRFAVTVDWRTADGVAGHGRALALTNETGAFSFFDSANLELLVKILDGRGVNGHDWVFFGALSNVDYTVRVTDRSTGAMRVYHNPQGTMASVVDTEAFSP